MTRFDLDRLIETLRRGRELDDGEPVDLLEHSLQCAALLRRRCPQDEELQIAGLVHDVGTIVSPDSADTHAQIGARWVGPLLGPRVAWLVEHHVVAKRYLLATDGAYRERLSPRSLETLEQQGGLGLDRDERAALEASADLGAVLALRRADDDAKVPGLDVAELDRWIDPLSAVARRARS